MFSVPFAADRAVLNAAEDQIVCSGPVGVLEAVRHGIDWAAHL